MLGYLLMVMDWLLVGASPVAGGSGPAIDGRLCPPMKPQTATAVVLSWLSRSVMCMCTSSVLLMTLGKRLPPGAARTPPTVNAQWRTQERKDAVGARRRSPRVLLNRNANPGGCYCYEGRVGGNVARNVAVAPCAGRTTPWVWHWAWNAGLRGWRKAQLAQGLFAGTRNPGSC